MTNDELDEILDYLTEDVAPDRRNVIKPVAKKQLQDYIKSQNLKLINDLIEYINSQYELSVSDVELWEHQNKTEMPILSKTQLVEALLKAKEGLK